MRALLSVHQGCGLASIQDASVINHHAGCRSLVVEAAGVAAAAHHQYGLQPSNSYPAGSWLCGSRVSVFVAQPGKGRWHPEAKRGHGNGRRRVGCAVGASLGFSADPRVGIERAANALLKDAATLLIYQEVFRSAPAQAFLKVLLALRRGDDGLKLLESYGEFFKLMAMGRYTSWEDYVLDSILAGEDNPFAEAAANVGNPKSSWLSRGVPASLKAAAASDLDTLQRLSITESTLSGWVTEIVTDVRPEWRTAAASSLSCKTVRKSGAVAEESSNNFGFSTSVGNENGGSELQCEEERFVDTVETSDSLHHPIPSFLDQEREVWRKKVGGLWRWSEAVPMLESYYATHGLGQVASSQVFQWKGGKLLRDPKRLFRTTSPCDLTIHSRHREALQDNLQKHASGSPAHHTVLFGPAMVGKSWLLNSVLSNLSRTTELRIVLLSQAEFKSLPSLLEELARHWQLRFALVIDDLTTRGGEERLWILKAALDGSYQEWPENVLVCATSAKVDITHAGSGEFADFKHLFGAVHHLNKLSVEDYLLCVGDLLRHRGKSEVNVEEQAKQWLRESNYISVQTVAHFVSSIL